MVLSCLTRYWAALQRQRTKISSHPGTAKLQGPLLNLPCQYFYIAVPPTLHKDPQILDQGWASEHWLPFLLDGPLSFSTVVLGFCVWLCQCQVDDPFPSSGPSSLSLELSEGSKERTPGTLPTPARHAEHLFWSRCYCELSPCLPSSNARHTVEPRETMLLQHTG